MDLVPNVPTNVQLDVLGNALKLTWKPPMDSLVASYTVRWSDKKNEPNSAKSLYVDGTSQQAFITTNLDRYDLLHSGVGRKLKSW